MCEGRTGKNGLKISCLVDMRSYFKQVLLKITHLKSSIDLIISYEKIKLFPLSDQNLIVSRMRAVMFVQELKINTGIVCSSSIRWQHAARIINEKGPVMFSFPFCLVIGVVQLDSKLTQKINFNWPTYISPANSRDCTAIFRD